MIPANSFSVALSDSQKTLDDIPITIERFTTMTNNVIFEEV